MWKLTDYCYGVVCTGLLLKGVRSYKKDNLNSTPALGKQSVFRRSASGYWAYGPFGLTHRSTLQNGESRTRGRLLCPLAVCSYRHCYENTHTHTTLSLVYLVCFWGFIYTLVVFSLAKQTTGISSTSRCHTQAPVCVFRLKTCCS